jgi:hypothetical protein
LGCQGAKDFDARFIGCVDGMGNVEIGHMVEKLTYEKNSRPTWVAKCALCISPGGKCDRIIQKDQSDQINIYTEKLSKSYKYVIILTKIAEEINISYKPNFLS